jgi:hypothetical protein
VEADWVTISALATAGGTLVLAIATFASVRSANRAARAAERSLLAGLRPVLTTSRLDDPAQKVMFADPAWLVVEGGRGAAQVTDDAILMAMSIRNVGSGMAVLHSWHFSTESPVGAADHAPLDEFHRLGRDIYIAPGDLGFWQGVFRDPNESEFATAREAIEARERLTIQLLYGDLEGGQRTISQLALVPVDDGKWLASTSRHWNLDRANPR